MDDMTWTPTSVPPTVQPTLSSDALNDIEKAAPGLTSMHSSFQTNIAFPSDRKDTLVEVFYLINHPPVICGLNGYISPDMIDEIQKRLDEDNAFFDKGCGTYLYRAVREEAQRGEYGRIELPAYWDLELVRYQSIATHHDAI